MSERAREWRQHTEECAWGQGRQRLAPRVPRTCIMRRLRSTEWCCSASTRSIVASSRSVASTYGSVVAAVGVDESLESASSEESRSASSSRRSASRSCSEAELAAPTEWRSITSCRFEYMGELPIDASSMRSWLICRGLATCCTMVADEGDMMDADADADDDDAVDGGGVQ